MATSSKAIPLDRAELAPSIEDSHSATNVRASM
jgi:hypothetical protein